MMRMGPGGQTPFQDPTNRMRCLRYPCCKLLASLGDCDWDWDWGSMQVDGHYRRSMIISKDLRHLHCQLALALIHTSLRKFILKGEKKLALLHTNTSLLATWPIVQLVYVTLAGEVFLFRLRVSLSVPSPCLHCCTLASRAA
jgi:hypothetical protein